MAEKKLAVVALGGNALVIDKNRKTIPDQFDAVNETVGHIADMIEDGWQVVISHGNGPQVGNILLRAEMASSVLPSSRNDRPRLCWSPG